MILLMRSLPSLTAGLARARHAVAPFLAALWRKARQRPLRALAILSFAVVLFALVSFKFESNYRDEWAKRVKGKRWHPPNWIKKYDDPAFKSDYGS